MKFAKYHGLGNDFIFVDGRDGLALSPAQAVALCDRRRGIGADGVLVAYPPVTPGAHARMHVWNSDGSIAEMCGNGLRCFVAALGTRERELVIDTNAGPLPCTVDHDGQISVRLGRPRLLRGDIPMTGPADATCIEQPYTVAGEPERRLTGVATGNPHAVTFVESSDEARRLASAIGPALERHPWFPEKANVEFAYMTSRHSIDVFVWERACGLTLACGTGASAVAVAAVLTDRADAGAPIAVRLPGGTLEITVWPGLANVAMRGPCVHVFDGDVDPL
ncbi:MAG TPA: diaminopimelate epimerase [Kofleriaceae bacterium]|nr:diaminopimelate epimerase [Kofleriaceae bacterium]